MSPSELLHSALEAAVTAALFPGADGKDAPGFLRRPDVASSIDAFAKRMLRLKGTRRLPVYLLLDTSGSMQGEPLAALRVGLESLVAAIGRDAAARDAVHLSVITFDREVKVLSELVAAASFRIPPIDAPESGPTHLGRALEVLCEQVDKELRRSGQASDWHPLLFVLTDGRPSDMQTFRAAIPEVRKRGFARIIGCTVGPQAKATDLSDLADEVVSHDTMDAAAFGQCLRWIDGSLGAPSPLPPPPIEGSTLL